MLWYFVCHFSGVITIASKLDRETDDRYELTVTAVDDVADRV